MRSILTFDIDPRDPSARGLPYEDFEALLDGIAPLRKMLLIDTCFSGEIDKDDTVVIGSPNDETQGHVSMRVFKAQRGVQIAADDSAYASVVRFQLDWFADLRRGTGAVVISSASGNEYAFEGEQWNNGVFTYALLQGLKNGEADIDRNHRITVGESQAYVIEQVRRLTAGGQNPTDLDPSWWISGFITARADARLSTLAVDDVSNALLYAQSLAPA